MGYNENNTEPAVAATPAEKTKPTASTSRRTVTSVLVLVAALLLGYVWVAALENSGAVPKLDRSSSLAGPDVDGNGIRDDIDAWIKAQNLSVAGTAAANQVAKAMQQAVMVDASNSATDQTVSLEMTRAINCMGDTLPDSFIQLVNSLQKFTADTPARVSAYLAYNSSQNGSVSSLPSGNTCDE